MGSTTTVTIPSVELSFDQLIAAIRQLEPEARLEIAKVLLESEMDTQMTTLIHSLAARTPAEWITDAAIDSEVKNIRSSVQK